MHCDCLVRVAFLLGRQGFYALLAFYGVGWSLGVRDGLDSNEHTYVRFRPRIFLLFGGFAA